MRREKVVEEPLPDWPALMTSAMAARYLSIDEASLLAICRDQGLQALAPVPGLVRWSRAELDRVLRQLPRARETLHQEMAPATPAAPAGISEQDLRRIAALLREGEQGRAHALSIKDAAALVGLGRSTLYSLIKQGRLTPVRIGSRTLLRRVELEALLES